MKYTLLGNSNLEISRIGFGCMSLDVAYVENSTTLINQAVEWGINFFDTADIYDQGKNEFLVGNALANVRDKVIIATKVGNQLRDGDKSGWNWNPGKQYILTAVEESLKRLKTDYIDLYQLHGGTINDPIDETIEAFEILKQQGKIRSYGISSIRPNVIKEYAKRSNITSVMMQYSLLDRRPEQECLSLLEKNNIGVLARGSLAKGLLSGKPVASYLGYSAGDVEKAAKAIKDHSSTTRTTAQTAFQFALFPQSITSIIAGIRTEAQLRDAVSAIEAPSLSQEEYEAIASSIPVNYYKEHL